MLKIHLTAIESSLHRAWQEACSDLENVEIHRGSILDIDCDAVISPANSFGFMDGGIDMVYSQHFGWHIQERLQALIRSKHHGELLVGSAEIVETDNPTIPFLISAPTMRIPMILGDATVHPFLAARAVFLLIKHGTFASGALVGESISSVVTSVAFPGLGTGIGRVPPATCAEQVRIAIEDVVLDNYEFPKSWSEASERHQKLYTDRPQNLQIRTTQ